MAAFLSGLAVALVLLIGGVILYSSTAVTVAERSSPQASVRLDGTVTAAQGAGNQARQSRRVSAPSSPNPA